VLELAAEDGYATEPKFYSLQNACFARIKLSINLLESIFFGDSLVAMPATAVSMRFSRILFLSVLAAAGCARFEPHPIEPARTAERLANRSLTNPELKTFIETNSHSQSLIWPTNVWNFERLTWAAFFYHPDLDIARAQWAVAQGGQTTAAQRPNPTLTATPGYDTTTSIPSPWLPLTFLDIPIETAGKRKYRRAHAARLAEAARLNIANVAWQVRRELRSALIEVSSSGQHVALLQRQVDLQTRIVGLLQGQIQAGAIAGSQAVPFRIALIRARLDLIDAQRLVSEARARVAEAVGIPLAGLDGIQLSFAGDESMEQILQLSSSDIRRNALQSRPDILQALAEYAASEAALRLEIAKQYPDVHLQPGYQYDQGDNKWSLGLVVELPVLSHNQGPVAEAKARREESAAKFNSVQAKALAEIDRATQAVQVAEKNLLALRPLLDEQAKRLDAVAGQLQAGAVDQLELLNAQSESLTAQVAQSDARVKLEQAVGNLEDAVRRPFEVPAAVFVPGYNQPHEP
jgi:outer membrane protein, heavy metal efflux system